MSDQYLVLQNGQQFGPFPMSHIAQMWRSNQIQQDALHWKEGWSQWQPLIDSQEMAALHPKPANALSPGRLIISCVVIALVAGWWIYSAMSKPKNRPAQTISSQVDYYSQGRDAGIAFAKQNFLEGSRTQKTDSALELTAKSKSGIVGKEDFIRGFKSGYRSEWNRLSK
jgi:hypothetical protein